MSQKQTIDKNSAINGANNIKIFNPNEDVGRYNGFKKDPKLRYHGDFAGQKRKQKVINTM